MALAEYIKTRRVCQAFRYQRARRTDRPRIQTTDHASKVRIWHAEAHALHKVVVAVLVERHAVLRIVIVHAILADRATPALADDLLGATRWREERRLHHLREEAIGCGCNAACNHHHPHMGLE